MINRWNVGDRVIADFELTDYGGPGEVVQAPADGTVLVQLDDGPAVWVEPHELDAVPDYVPEPAPDPDGCHTWARGMGAES